MKKENIYSKNGTTFKFIKSNSIPSDVPISTPLTFAFLGKDLIMSKKKSGEWDILGGKVEGGETWIDAIKRESLEEAGVFIKNIEVIGYFLALNESKNTSFPKKCILPITISYVDFVEKNWKPRETLERNSFRKKEVISLLEKRADAEQIIPIFEYALSKVNELEIEYVLDTSNSFNKIPTTQVMVFCKDSSGNFCIVRDYDETKYSLPGGGCNLGEGDLECAQRELFEEAQLVLKKPKIIGSVIIHFKKNGLILSRIKHVRVFGEALELNDFVPRLNGFEVEERKFISIDKLIENVPLLQNTASKEIISLIKKRLIL